MLAADYIVHSVKVKFLRERNSSRLHEMLGSFGKFRDSAVFFPDGFVANNERSNSRKLAYEPDHLKMHINLNREMFTG